MIIARNLFKLARFTPRCFYSTAPPGDAPAFKFPRRWEMQVAAFDEVYDVMNGLTQYQQFANLLRVLIIVFRITLSTLPTSIWGICT